jgi:F-type H+-transporting ATPase subunit a
MTPARGILLIVVLLLAAFPQALPAADHAADAHHEPQPQDEVLDSTTWHFFENSSFDFKIQLGWFKIFGQPVPTKFMVIELLGALVIAWLMIGLAKQMKDGNPVRGPLWNAMEALTLFIRDEIARPYLGGHGDHHEEEHGEHHAHDAHAHAHHEVKRQHPGDQFVPYLLTAFLFILFMNVFGLVPFLGSPTSSIYVTGALALCSFFLIHGTAIAKNGFAKHMKSMWMDIDIPPMFGIGPITFGGGLSLFIKVLIFILDMVGTVIKSGVLAVRLFANIFAGHMVVASILFFIYLTRESHQLLWGAVTFASVLGVVALSLLELFVAFLQAYIFVFLTALFTGMIANPEH